MLMNMGLCVLSCVSAAVLRDQRPLICRAGAMGGCELTSLGAGTVKETPAESGLSWPLVRQEAYTNTCFHREILYLLGKKS